MRLRFSSLALTTVSALVVGILVGQPAAATPALPLAAQIPPPQNDPFYTPPSPIPRVPPGTVLRSRRVDVSPSSNVVGTKVNAWQVLYRSTSATRKANAVSGTVMVPKTPWPNGPRPVVAYAVGTHGLGPTCAPSYKLVTGTEREYARFDQALAKGWAVVVTDYEGLGTPGPHTYVAGRSLGHAMLDAARAAQSLRGAGLSRKSAVGLWGYSEGGFAAGWAAELENGYAPELDVVGSAVGAAPADLKAMARVHDGGPASGLILAAAVGLAKAFPQAPFAEILTAEGKQMAKAIGKQCVEELTVNYAFKKLSSYTTVDDPMALPSWRAVLAAVRLGKGRPKAPAMIYHAPGDELVLFNQGVQLQQQWCAAGATVQFQPAVAGEHLTGAITGAPLAVDYLAGRFAKKPAPSTCLEQP